MTVPPHKSTVVPAVLVLLAGVFLSGVGVPAARADKPSDALAKYDKRIDDSIDRALKYLAKIQQRNGSFRADGMRDNTGIASLCVMAFLSKGYTPGTGPYGDVIDKGIDFVLSKANANGMIVGRPSHGPMYSHCISTLLLSEVSGMVNRARQKKIDAILPEALKIILSAQRVKKDSNNEGGWRYQHTSKDSDISCTGWAVMALRSARGNGARVPTESIDKALQYILRCRHSSGGFTYQARRGEPGDARTGTALLCLQLMGKHKAKVNQQAGDWLMKHLPERFGGNHFYYGLYYCSQGMFQLGGKYWESYARRLYEMMLKFQRKDGSWPPESGTAGRAGQAYATAMSVLAMAVSYRQLPIYQR